MHDVLLDKLFLLLAQIQCLHFGLKHIPGFLSFTFIDFESVIARFDIGLRIFSFFFHRLSDIICAALLFFCSTCSSCICLRLSSGLRSTRCLTRVVLSLSSFWLLLLLLCLHLLFPLTLSGITGCRLLFSCLSRNGALCTGPTASVLLLMLMLLARLGLSTFLLHCVHSKVSKYVLAFQNLNLWDRKIINYNEIILNLFS